ncbi:lamin tail domain-containing protein [Candidatus Woesearchaeota archaeon]|jgi:hypothetical protein|nr:lamin tail domain-containing protein [Candidatus Woesearchaeota archaeon]
MFDVLLTKLIKKFVTLILFFFIASSLTPIAFAALDYIVISEVYYNPISSETGGEAIELFNPTNEVVNLSGYVIKTESSNEDLVFDNSDVDLLLLPNQFLLLTDLGWDENKDNISWSTSNYEESFTLSNSDAGVALVLDGIIIDSVGWGLETEIGEGLFEGNSSIGVSEGFSLQRTSLFNDSNNNSADFFGSYPNLLNSSFFFNQSNSTNLTEPIIPSNSSNSSLYNSSVEIEIELEILNSEPILSNLILFDYEELIENAEILLNPGGEKVIGLNLTVTDLNGFLDVDSCFVENEKLNIYSELIFLEELNSSSFVAGGEFNLDYYLSEGTYNLSIFCEDNYSVNYVNYSIEILSLSALSLDVNYLLFEQAILGTYVEILGDSNFETNNPTIQNIGNTNLSVGLIGTNLTINSGSESDGGSDGGSDIDSDLDGDGSIITEISSKNLEFVLGNDFNLGIDGTLDSFVVSSKILECGLNQFIPLSFRLFVPSQAMSGTYQGTALVVGVSE